MPVVPPSRQPFNVRPLAALLLVAIASVSAQVAPPAPSAPASRPAGTRPAEDAVQLSVFTVTEERETGYESTQTTSSMRTAQQLKNVANSISIMNAQLILDTASLTMDEMTNWFVSGESNPEPHQYVAGRVVLRGIANAYAMRNGWIWYSPVDTFSTERVEILRGPNAFLYGEADIGGAQNQITKRGLFGRDLTQARLMFGNFDLRRAEIDLNRRLIRDRLALRFSAVQNTNRSWQENVKRDFFGAYLAVTYRPTRATAIHVMGEHGRHFSVNSQGLFVDQFSRTQTATIPAAGGFIYVPAAGLMYRAPGTGRIQSTGPGITIVDPTIVRPERQFAGSNSTYANTFDSLTIEAEHHIGSNLHLQLTGNAYQQNLDVWSASARNVYRDVNRTLPNGQPNPYFGELYQEYYRIRGLNGNNVRDFRFSAVYDLNTKWMKQQFVFNAQQHQDTPGAQRAKWGEYLDPANPAWTGTINPEVSQAAFTANRTVFTNNRFMRRFYLKDGAAGTDQMGPVSGVSAWYPDLSNQIGATGQTLYRRFYTPSWGVGASGSYFKEHFFTLVGYRRDHFNMKSVYGTVRPLKDQWAVDFIPSAFAPNPAFAQYKVDGANYGAIFRLNDHFALGYNYAQSFRISSGEGNLSYRIGQRQGIPVGEGQDFSARLSLLGGRVELNVTRYDNFSPNARFSPGPTVQVRDELTAIFPSTFLATGTDLQQTTTQGYEVELVANLTRQWRLTANVATNKVVNEERAPLLKSFQEEARALGRPTPLLNDFLRTIPEGLPNPGYTKTRFNLFTRYSFNRGFLKGSYVGGGVNYRAQTYRGTADLDGIAATPVVDLWSPGYSLYSALAGYDCRIYERPTTFALNVSNLFDKLYYRSGGIGSGSWGEPRTWRFSVRTDF